MTAITGISMLAEDGTEVRNSEDDGIELQLQSGRTIRLSFADLADRERTANAIYEQIGHRLPDDYDDERHVEVVRAALRLCGYVETVR